MAVDESEIAYAKKDQLIKMFTDFNNLYKNEVQWQKHMSDKSMEGEGITV